ncbi:outer membrane lipoprotein-sorting protein [Draconibacterium halophilum]|uniref:Outer membrane lipoprotein-sorting protein n=1 Tax=Draconibacterium halophilum TaxID=2706887 RepID=A0A6C0R850_9BACT|nr:outer membrane lipoprotein-sorting protein [Draconibacterium halophilum]QIA06309.1 outer membrane lipoprotein-sorting protein [Draconibacterium halophilum]
MKRTFLLAALMLFALISTQAQSLDKVLDSYYKANGLDKIADVKTFDIEAKVSVMGMEMPMHIRVKNPDKFRVDMEMMGQKTTSAFDGENGWMINPMMGAGVQDLEGAQLKQAMGQADMEGALYNYKAKGSNIEMLGKVDADGAEAYKLKLTDKDGAVQTYYINADDYMISKVESKAEAMGQSMDIVTKMVEYKDVKGIKMASKMEIEMPMGKQSVVMEEIKIDEPIDDTIFEKPAK